MSDKIEALIQELTDDISESNIQITEKDDAILSQSQVDKKVATLEKKSGELLKRYEKGSVNDEKAKARVRKYQKQLNKLTKQATGKSKPNMNKVGKAQPRPANSNPNNVRCYMRYNNQGSIYRICNDGSTSSSKPKAQITAPISVDAFMNNLGKTYGELTDGQAREYHRLDMANRRFAERGNQAEYQETIDSVLAQQRKAGGLLQQQSRLEEQQAINNFKLEVAKRQERAKKENNMTDAQFKSGLNNKIKTKYGLSDKALERLRKKTGAPENTKITRKVKRAKIKKQQENINEKLDTSGEAIKGVGQDLMKLKDELTEVNKKIKAKEEKANKSGKDLDTSDAIFGRQIQLQGEISKVQNTINKLQKLGPPKKERKAGESIKLDFS